MSGTTTPNLGLFNTNMLTDGDDFFDFDRDLNGNNNILDAAIGKLSTLTTEEKSSLVAAINELVAGKSSIDLDNLSSIGQAIMDKKVEVEALLQLNGYAKFTWKENNQISNLILQWGWVVNITNGTHAVTLPVEYSNANCIAIITTTQPAAGFATLTRTDGGFTVTISGSPTNLNFDYFSVGY